MRKNKTKKEIDYKARENYRVCLATIDYMIALSDACATNRARTINERLWWQDMIKRVKVWKKIILKAGWKGKPIAFADNPAFRMPGPPSL